MKFFQLLKLIEIKQLPAASHKGTFGISQTREFALRFICTAIQFVSPRFKAER